MSLKKFTLALAAAATFGVSTLAHAASIDTFNEGAVSVSGPAGPTLQAGVSGTLGGNRTYTLDLAGTQLQIDLADDGLLRFSNDDNVDGTLTLGYSSAGTDLDNGIDNALGFVFTNADQAFNLSVTVNGVNVNNNYGAGAQIVVIPFASFIGVDWNNVTTATIALSPNNDLGGDYRLDAIETTMVPAPAALPAGLALMGFLAAARRRR